MRKSVTGAIDIRPSGSVESTFIDLTRAHENRHRKISESEADERPGVFDDDRAEAMLWGIVAEIVTEDADFADYLDGHQLLESMTKADLALLEGARKRVERFARQRSGVFEKNVLDGLDALVE